MVRRALALVLLVAAQGGCAGEQAPRDPLDAYIEQEMDEGGIPGLAAAILKDGQVVWTGLYGYADVENKRHVDEDTLFVVASVSKTVAVMPLMRLVDEGVVDLDVPLETYLPYPVRHPDYPDVPITARMLLTHTSGLIDNWPILGMVTGEGDPTMSLGEFAEAYVTPGGALYSPSNFGAQPGTQRSYCNAGFGVVGALIERTGPGSLRDQARTVVFEPLHMDSSGFFLADVDADHLAVPYTYNRARSSFVPLSQTGFAHYPAGTLHTSLHDLSRFLGALMNGGELEGGRIIPAETLSGMFEVQFPELSRGQALVFQYDTIGEHRYVGHSGATIGGSAQMLFRREDGLGIILMENGDAYLRARLGFDEGSLALEAILERLDEETAVYAL